MNFLDKLNLSTGERRLVVGGAIILFIVLNAVFVWPHFMDWQRYNNRYNKAEKKLQEWTQEINESSGYSAKLEKLKGEGGVVPEEDQALDLQRLVSLEANVSGLRNNGIRDVNTSSQNTNAFFAENGVNISYFGSEKQLVDFLYKIGSGSSIIRVGALVIRPDVQNFQLSGTATLIASYRKDLKKLAAAEEAKARAKAKTAAPSAGKPGPTNKPPERAKPSNINLPKPKAP